MASVQRLRRRNATIVVEARGQALFMPGADLWRWKNRFTARTKAATATAAPTNKRPRWGHYGKPLKSTIIADTRTRITSGGGFFYMAVGSTAPHALYVDQGTGVHAGNGPYEAKILPPWQRESPSLYEASWHRSSRRAPVMIEGQRGQKFFDTGLAMGFRSMRLRSFQVPGEGASNISSAMKTIPTDLTNMLGNQPPSAGFQASLTEWREWRDRAYNAGEVLGHNATGRRSVAGGTRRSRATVGRTRRTSAENEARKAASRVRSAAYRERNRSIKDAQSAKGRVSNVARTAERARFLAAMLKKYGAGNVERSSLTLRNGYYYVTVRVGRDFKEVRGKASV